MPGCVSDFLGIQDSKSVSITGHLSSKIRLKKEVNVVKFGWHLRLRQE